VLLISRGGPDWNARCADDEPVCRDDDDRRGADGHEDPTVARPFDSLRVATRPPGMLPALFPTGAQVAESSRPGVRRVLTAILTLTISLAFAGAGLALQGH